MKSLVQRTGALALLFACSTGGLQAATFREQLAEKLTSCEYALEVVMDKPATAIPTQALRQARGVIVVHQYRVGFIIGGQGGSAVLIARNPQSGNWGPPVFLDPGGINIGLQAGAKEINSVFLLMNDDAVQRAYSGRFNVGVDASAVAGPNAAEVENFDLFKVPVLVYTSNGGLFAGASMKTGWLTPFDRANRELYRTTYSTPEIVLSTWFQVPAEAQSFVVRLRNYEGGRH